MLSALSSAVALLADHPWLRLAVLAAALAAAAYRFSTSTYDKWSRSGVPFVRPVPLFGNYLNVALCIDTPADVYLRVYRELAGRRYGGMFQMRTPYLMLRDPALVNRVLIKDFAHFPDRGIHAEFAKEPLTEHLFFVENPAWRRMRAKLAPAFASGRLKVMYEQIDECGAELMKNLEDKLLEAGGAGGAVDVRGLLATYAMDVIGTCAFGLRLNAISDDASPFRRYGNALFRPSVRYFLRELLLMTSPALLRLSWLTFFPLEATRFFDSVFRETIEYRERNNVVRNDYVHTLMQARKDLVLNDDLPPDEKCTELQIVANAFVMFAAGFETVSTATSYCLHELALKKRIQDKVRDEIKSKRAKYNGVVTSEFLSELNYLDMVLAETLRKYPATFAVFRKAAQTYHVPDDTLVIEKGQKIVIPIMALHNDPKYYTDPEVFDPERFSPEEKAKRPSGVYLPFGDGPRICIGKRFAEMEMKLALVKLLSKYEVETCEKTEIPVVFTNLSLVAVPNSGKMWLKLNELPADS